jgi:hypothetical protein
MSQTQPPRTLSLARTLSTWLDARYLDPLFGLIAPGVGDLVTILQGLSVGDIGLDLEWRLEF